MLTLPTKVLWQCNNCS